MSAQTIGEQVRWQDLKVRSEADIVFDIAKREGWQDCEVFGSGDMITQPQESKGWKLIPADLYKYSIPMQAVARLHEVINAGIRVQGVIIADDTRREEPAPAPVEPEEQKTVPLPAPEAQAIELALPGQHRTDPPTELALPRVDLLAAAGAVVSFAGKALLGLIRVAIVLALVAGALALAVGVIGLVGSVIHQLIRFWPVIPVVLFLFACAGSSTGTSTGTGRVSRVDYDPKLVILVEDGKGGTAWISLFTWYD
jgi:hypothetical protein